MGDEPRVRVEVWSDVICPWCYIGKRRLERALRQFPHADEVAVRWRSFQLNPGYPKGTEQPAYEYLARNVAGSEAVARSMAERVTALAAQEGLSYDYDRMRVVNTFDAHRLTQLAQAHGVGGEAHERLLHAHFVEGESLADPETLVRLGAEVGVPAQESRQTLAGDAYAADVEADTREAARLGATGVPFFVLNRSYGVAGAQSMETFLSALHTAYESPRPPAP